jgi:hypothetical protein
MEREWLLLQMQRRTTLVRNAINVQRKRKARDDGVTVSVGALFDEYDEDCDGALNHAEMLRLLQGLNMQKRGQRQVLWTATDAAELCKSMNSAREGGVAEEAVLRSTFLDTFGGKESKPAAVVGSAADADVDADAAFAQQLMAEEANGSKGSAASAASDAFSFADDLPRVPAGKWMCMTCTMHNPISLFYCEVCDMARPDLVHTRF